MESKEIYLQKCFGIHYGFYDNEEIDVLECNLEEFFNESTK